MRARPPRGRGRIPPRRNPRAGWAGNAPAKGGGRGATVFPTAEGLPPFAGRPPPPRTSPTPQAEGAGRALPDLVPPPPILPPPHPLPYPHAHRHGPSPARGDSTSFFCYRIPCLERVLSATDSKYRSNPGPLRAPTSTFLRRQERRSSSHPTPRPCPPPQARVQGLPCLAAVPNPQAKAAGRLVSRTPFATPSSYLGLVPRTPSMAFVSYLDRATQTRDCQTSPKLGRVSHGHSNETNPSCADSCAVQVP